MRQGPILTGHGGLQHTTILGKRGGDGEKIQGGWRERGRLCAF